MSVVLGKRSRTACARCRLLPTPQSVRTAAGPRQLRQASVEAFSGQDHHKDFVALKPGNPPRVNLSEPHRARMGSGIRKELQDLQKKYDADISSHLDEYRGSALEMTGMADSEVQGESSEFVPSGLVDMEDLDVLDPQHRMLRPGDLVELSPPDPLQDPFIGVYVRKLGIEQSRCQVFLGNGKWITTPYSYVVAAVPDFMDPDLVMKLVPHLPKDLSRQLENHAQTYDISVPRHVSAPIVSQLHRFETTVRDVYREHASRLERAHELLAHEDDLKFGTVTQIARKLLERPSDEELSYHDIFAVRLALRRAHFAFGCDQLHHRATGIVYIRSKVLVRSTNNVTNWLREFRDEMATHPPDADPLELSLKSPGAKIVQEFAKKAKAVVLESRKDREPTMSGCIGPSKQRFEIGSSSPSCRFESGPSWSTNEEQIIRYLEAEACSRTFSSAVYLPAQPPVLLRATGLYEGFEHNKKTAFLFLQELGHFSPYESRISLDEDLLLPTDRFSRLMAQLRKKLDEGVDPNAANGFLTQDALRDIRQDWGQRPVFCIDSEGAKEIDDGISIEKVPGGGAWIHVHVANPTAFFTPTSPIAILARHMTETVYTPERTYRMLPSWATHNHFSLGADRPCLTFSARLGDDGLMLDHKITAGIIRNVHFLTPGEVNEALGLANEGDSKELVMTIGGKPPTTSDKSPAGLVKLAHKSKTALKDIYHFSKLRFAQRSKNAGISLPRKTAEVRVWDRMDALGLSDTPHRIGQVTRTVGDPVIQLRTKVSQTETQALGEADSSDMIKECMLLAGEIGSKWCDERNVPNLYRASLPGLSHSSLPNFERMETQQEYYKRVLEPAVRANNGSLPSHLLYQYMARSNPVTLGTKPGYHHHLGLSRFSKVTSPLRRFGDMVVHWQIQAALLEEHERGVSLKTTKSNHNLPYTEANLSQMSETLRTRESRIVRAKETAINFWVCQFLFRSIYFGEHEMPRTVTVHLLSESGDMRNLRFHVVVMELGVPAEVRPHRTDPAEFQIGDLWECYFDEINPYHRVVALSPIRLIRRAQPVPT